MRRARNRVLTGVAVATLTLTACGGDDGPASDTPDATDSSQPEPDGADEPDDGDDPVDEPGAAPPEVELLDEGTDPRPLRFDLQDGASVTGTFAFEFAVTSLTIDGQDGPATPPLTVETDLVAEVTSLDGDDAEVEFTYQDPRLGDVDLSDEERAAVEEAIAALDGVTGRLTIDDRGIVSDATVDADADALPGLDQIGDQLASLTLPFPEEPVGEGGSWQVTQTTEINGIVTEQVSTVTLGQRDGEEVTIEVTVEGSSPAGPIHLPEAPGAEVELVSLTLTGSGTNVVDLSSPLPASGEAVVDGDQVLEITEGEQTSTLEQSFTVSARFTAG